MSERLSPPEAFYASASSAAPWQYSRHGNNKGDLLDSVTQIALGAAVGEAVLGRKVGSRAILWGALCGTLPDLDVFIPFAGPVEAFTYHRSFSHSILVALLATPLIAWLILKLHPDTAPQRRGWLLLVYLA